MTFVALSYVALADYFSCEIDEEHMERKSKFHTILQNDPRHVDVISARISKDETSLLSVGQICKVCFDAL